MPSFNLKYKNFDKLTAIHFHKRAQVLKLYAK